MWGWQCVGGEASLDGRQECDGGNVRVESVGQRATYRGGKAVGRNLERERGRIKLERNYEEECSLERGDIWRKKCGRGYLGTGM